MVVQSATMAIITSAAAAVGAGGFFLKLYDELRGLMGPSTKEVYDYADKMEANLRQMECTADDLYLMRLEALNYYERTPRSKGWIDKVNKLKGSVNELKSKYPSAEKGKEVGSIWQCWAFSKALETMHVELQHHVQKWSEIEKSLEKIPAISKVQAPKIEDKPSLYKVFKNITEYFKDKEVKNIGLCGMPGVGKTAIMQNLNNSEQAEDFDIVIFATLPDERSREKLNFGNGESMPDALKLAIEKLRQAIAARLHLKIEEGMADFHITSRISEKLKDKKCLFLLDDVWHPFKLNDIGICSNEGNKVILASRYKNTCDDMNIHAIVKMERLPVTEGLILFREKLCPIDKPPEFDQVAEPAVEHCASLPLLIEKAAGCFKKKDSEHWPKILDDFKKWPYGDYHPMVELHNELRFCYESLDNQHKKCFLYCALHTEDSEISSNYLVECCKAEKFVPNVDKGHMIVDDLINAYFLEKNEIKKSIRMSKEFRSMALKVLSEWKDLKFLVKAGVLKERLSVKEWEEAQRISLMDNSHILSSLPEKPNCTNLSTLFLQRNVALKSIPDDFFKSMQNLLVLDLHGIQVQKLPSPFCLESLEVLYLSCCDQLTELPREMKLENLEVLDIRGTAIHYLPIQILNMKKLRCLRISFSRFDEKSNEEEEQQVVISDLPLLQELVIEVKNECCHNVMEHIMEEVAKLRNLTSLSFRFHNKESFKTFLRNSKLWQDPHFTFQVCVGQQDSIRRFKSARVQNIDNAIISSLVIATTDDRFELIGHKDAWNLSKFGIENINELKCLIIEGAKNIRAVIDAKGTREGVLKRLKRIYISHVLMLESIFWKDHVPGGSLAELAVFHLTNCPNLKKIFSSAMIKQLSNLQHLHIENCPQIEQIIVESGNDGSEQLMLPSLRKYELRNLPELKSFWKNDLICPLLISGTVQNCDKLEHFNNI